MVGYFLYQAPYEEDFKEIFIKYFPYTMSNLAYLRAIAQYFSYIFMIKCNKSFYCLLVLNIFQDNFAKENPIYKEFIDYIETHKDSIYLKEKFDMMLVNYDHILNKFDLNFLFQTKFDDFGELINSSAVEQLKEILVNYIQDLKLVFIN